MNILARATSTVAGSACCLSSSSVGGSPQQRTWCRSKCVPSTTGHWCVTWGNSVTNSMQFLLPCQSADDWSGASGSGSVANATGRWRERGESHFSCVNGQKAHTLIKYSFQLSISASSCVISYQSFSFVYLIPSTSCSTSLLLIIHTDHGPPLWRE